MQPMRSRGIFGPGGPLNTTTVATKLAIGIVAGSVIAWLARPYDREILLIPSMVVESLRLWQPLTYSFIADEPIGVIFGALIMWSLGGALEMRWGPRRLVAFAVGSTVLAGFLTAVLGLVVEPVYRGVFGGATVMTSAAWVAYGWSLGRMQSNFWGLPLSGNGLAWIGVGFVGLQAAFMRSVWPVVPEILAIAFAYVYVKVGTPSVLVRRLQLWRLQREAKARSKHLRVVTKERNTSSGSDRFIH